MDIREISDYKAEAGVISTLVYHPEFILRSPYLHEKYFYNTDNACIYWAIRNLYAKKITKITALNIEQILDSNPSVKKKLQEYNINNIQEYIDLCFQSKRDTVEEYKLLVDRVVSLSFKREMFKTVSRWQRLCQDENVSLDDLNIKVYKDLNGLTSKYVTGGEITTLGSKAKSLWESIREKKERGEMYGLPSFFPSLAPFFSYEDGELVVLEARMGTGKSFICMMEALHKAMNGVPTFVQDSEMTDENWYIRVLSYLTGIDTKRIKNETLTEEESVRIDKANECLETVPLFHNYDPYITKERFYSICSQKKIEAGLKFVVWDYIKADDTILDPAERSSYLGGMTNFLKNVIAGDLNIPVLAFCQLNRVGQVAESDGIERYCSVALKWERKTEEEITNDGKECGNYKLIVKKNRLGREHIGEGEYIDMMKFADRICITEAKQHKEANPFDE